MGKINTTMKDQPHLPRSRQTSFPKDHWFPYADRLKRDLQELSSKTGIKDWKSKEGQAILEKVQKEQQLREEIEDPDRKDQGSIYTYAVMSSTRNRMNHHQGAE